MLAAYVVFEGVRSLIGGEEPDTSDAGLVLLAVSVVAMPLLARAWRRVGEQLMAVNPPSAEASRR